MKSKQTKKTSDAVAILHRRFVKSNTAKKALQEIRNNSDIAQKIYDLRTAAGLTQKQLAALVETSESVISRLEDADYDGYNLKTLQRIAAAVHKRLEINFVDERELQTA